VRGAPCFVAIGGPTCSGKTSLARTLAARLHGARVLSLDAYYRDLSGLSPAERSRRNFDEPDALDWPLLRAQLARLARGEAVPVPRYDFSTHCRADACDPFDPAPWVLLEGLFALHDPEVRAACALCVYVDVDLDQALARRLSRDTRERGRSADSVRQQFEDTVRPMTLRHIVPTRQWADLVIAPGEPWDHAVARIQDRLLPRTQPVTNPTEGDPGHGLQ